MNDKLGASIVYSKKGWVVHPLASPQDKGKSPGKRPLLKDWQKLKETPKDIDSHIKNGRNIGLVCGNVSDVTVIDFDHEIFINELLEGIEIDTLMCRRTQGRGHIYFKYNPKLPSQSHHDLGIEILSDGRNVVLPPSIHASGESYKWNDPDKQIIEMPAKLVENLMKLFEREKKLTSLINKCRPCFRKYWKDETKICHGATAREFVGAFCSELYNKGADLDMIKMFAKIIYQKDYNESKTETEFNGWTQKGYKPWTCEKLRERCAGFTDCDTCKVKKSGRTNGNGNGATYSQSQASALIAYVNSENVELFHDDRGDSYARVRIEGKSTIMSITGRQFRRWITGQFFDDTGNAPGGDAITSALNVIEAKAWRKGKEYKLHNRIASHDGAFWYDIGDGTAARIDERGWEIKNRPILFKSYSHQKPHSSSEIMSFQDKGGNVKHILDYVNLRDETDRLLFVVYLISCFVPDIPHPIPEAHGDKGSAKSTAFKLLKRIIDPSITELLNLPRDHQSLIQILDHHYFVPFDNLSTLSDSQSDALCRACTGEGFSKRALYTNDDDVIFDYQRCVALNGVNIVATRPDLLDRSILFRFERVLKAQRKPDDVIWKSFEEVKGKILAGIFTILSRAMAIKPTMYLDEMPRMAAFMLWGCAISEAMGDGWKAFYDAYNANIQSQNKEALEASPIGELILKFMEDKPSWEGRAANLLSELEEMAGLLRVNTKDKEFPKAPNSLTRRINEIKTNLSEEGIQFEVRRNEKVRTLFLLKVSENAVSTVIPSASASGGGTKHDGIEKTNRPDTVRDDKSDDTCRSADGIPSVLLTGKNQDAAVLADGTDANDGISRHTLEGVQNQEFCDICKQPLNGNKETEQGLQGQGLIHKECKYLPIKIRFLIGFPDFCKYPDGNHRSYKAGDEDYIQATQACALILKRAAIRIEGSV